MGKRGAVHTYAFYGQSSKGQKWAHWSDTDRYLFECNFGWHAQAHNNLEFNSKPIAIFEVNDSSIEIPVLVPSVLLMQRLVSLL